jgi:hypothetical protein
MALFGACSIHTTSIPVALAGIPVSAEKVTGPLAKELIAQAANVTIESIDEWESGDASTRKGVMIANYIRGLIDDCHMVPGSAGLSVYLRSIETLLPPPGSLEPDLVAKQVTVMPLRPAPITVPDLEDFYGTSTPSSTLVIMKARALRIKVAGK